MLVAVVIGVIFTYPVLFLPDFASSGISVLPHHVWTGSSSFESQPNKQPDLEMRQIWFQGSYMQALNKSTLIKALEVQRSILGEVSPNTHLAESTWGFQSPSLYWNSSDTLLANDDDILDTINSQPQETSFLNFTLRPLSVFAGKSYASSKLIAADALVLTLYNCLNDSMGSIWQSNIENVVRDPPNLWHVDNGEAATASGRVYEYRFQPLSFRQNSALALAYGFMGLYVYASLRRLKAFRSRFGLVVTAITQMTTSILASFTICGLLKINLAQIPQEAYPFVVLTIGLENIFRLINAVLAYPPEMPPQQRIANGLGDIGHSSLVSAAQNLLILWLLSLVVSPGVSAFCAFAAVALLFDFFFFITFFVAVLNVDIRRLELQDSITRSRSRSPKDAKKASGRPSWLDALAQGRVPFSTRTAGSVVTFTFVLALNWHFSDYSLSALRRKSWSALTDSETFTAVEPPPPPTDQSNYPSSRVRMQDYDDALHFMSIVNPGPQSFTARVFSPLIMVLSEADRSGVPLDRYGWLSAVRNLAMHHVYPFALVVVFVVAFVTALMNFLLWNERVDDGEKENIVPESGPLTIQKISTSHKLDIAMLANSSGHHLLSAGLDRNICLTVYDKATQSYVQMQVAARIEDDPKLIVKWPVTACVLDDESENLAILGGDRKILIGNLGDGMLTRSINEFASQSAELPVLLELVNKSARSKDGRSLVAVSAEGILFDCSVAQNTTTTERLVEGDDTVLAACIVHASDGAVIATALTASGVLSCRLWNSTTRVWSACNPAPATSILDETAALDATLYSLTSAGLVMLCTENEVRLIDPVDMKNTLVVPVIGAKPRSFRFLHASLENCPECSGLATKSFAIAYTEEHTGDCVLTSYTAVDADNGLICLLAKKEGCQDMTNAAASEHRIKSPGMWETTRSQVIAGVRRSTSSQNLESVVDNDITQATSLRRRRKIICEQEETSRDADDWEAYIMTMNGEVHCMPLPISSESDTQLLASEPGPLCRVGPNSVGIAMGNVVYTITAGFENGTAEMDLKRTSSSASASVPTRRKPRKSQ